MSDIAIRVENLGKQYHIGMLRRKVGVIHTNPSVNRLRRQHTRPSGSFVL